MHMNRIEINPRVCGGKPVIRGTRIPVAVLVAQLAEGQSWQDVIRGYPELSGEDIRAALEYASTSVENTEFAETAAR
jgi:uncharacterized protein (DUF433 family)